MIKVVEYDLLTVVRHVLAESLIGAVAVDDYYW